MSDWWSPGEQASGRTDGVPLPPPGAAQPAAAWPAGPEPAPPPPSGTGGHSKLVKRGAVAAVACLAVAGASIAIAGRGTGAPAAATSLSASGSTTTTTPPKPPWPAPPFGKAGGGPGRRLFGGGAGTVTAVTSGGFTVKMPDGTSVTFTTSSSTQYREGPVSVTRSALAVGDQVVVGAARPASSASSSSSRAAQVVLLISPEVAGKVVSVSGSTVVVQDSEGFWRTVDVSGSTVYQSAGKASSLSSVKVGVYVAAAGTIASDHTTLDASAVEVLGTNPQNGHGPGSRGDFGLGAGGPGPAGFGGPGAAFFGGPGLAFPGGPATGVQSGQSSSSATTN